jgi:hypothetical protein
MENLSRRYNIDKKRRREFIMSKNVKGGLLLVGAGIILLLSMLGVIPGVLVVLMLGAGFCTAYAVLGGRREYGNIGFLIPGTVLLAVGGHAPLSSALGTGQFNGVVFFFLLSLSFLAVLFVHTYWFKELEHGERFWPVYPSLGLLLFTAVISVSEVWGWDFPLQAINYLWVAALMGAGLWLMRTGKVKQ